MWFYQLSFTVFFHGFGKVRTLEHNDGQRQSAFRPVLRLGAASVMVRPQLGLTC